MALNLRAGFRLLFVPNHIRNPRDAEPHTSTERIHAEPAHD
jgi:hypothetical protein